MNPRTATEAKALGWEVDDHCYPWVAYEGPRFSPMRWVNIETPSWSPPVNAEAAA